MEYTVIQHSDCISLVRSVNEEIAKGWVPLGGVCVIPESNYSTEWYVQAMTRQDEGTK